MNRMTKILDLLKVKPARKLVIITAVLTFLMLMLSLAGTFTISVVDEITFLNATIDALPKMVVDRTEETLE